MFIVFEGLDLSGKTTMMAKVGKLLENLGYTVAYHKEPSDSVKEILKKFSNKTIQYKAIMDYRKEHQKSLKEDLEKYDFVLCDRYITSTFVFQGLGVDTNKIEEENKDFLQPNLEIVLQISYQEYKNRCGTRLTDRLDRFDFNEYKKYLQRYRYFTNGVMLKDVSAEDIVFAIMLNKKDN